MVNKNINHDAGCGMQDAECESVQTPMNTGCSARGAEGAGQDGDVQSPRSKVQSHVAGEAEFDDLRSKTGFFPKRNDQALKPNF
jgi:hypothetical protein